MAYCDRHVSHCEDGHVVGCDAVQCGINILTFRRNLKRKVRDLTTGMEGSGQVLL